MTDMIFPELGQVGRLGNQLWQFASTCGIAWDHGFEPRFPDDWAYRPFFSVLDDYFVPRDQMEGRHPTEFVPHIDERARIYLQDLSLFARSIDAIRLLLQPSQLARAELNRYPGLPEPVLAVHVRRGDNVKDPGVPDKWRYYPVPSVEFYKRGIAQYGSEIGVASVAVFSDDIPWCRANLSAEYFHEGVARPKEHEPAWHTAPVLDWIDIMLGARCASHVIGNSTYGTWMALLARDPAAIIPDPWYGPALAYIDSDLQFPPTWRKLSC